MLSIPYRGAVGHFQVGLAYPFLKDYLVPEHLGNSAYPELLSRINVAHSFVKGMIGAGIAWDKQLLARRWNPLGEAVWALWWD